MINKVTPERHRVKLLVRLGVAGAVFALAACASGGGSDTARESNREPATTTTSRAPAPASSGTVDANSASIAELTAAFEAAGIPNAARWAFEVDEYRPYPTDDPTFAKLRQELAKYNPSDEIVEQIVASLTL